MENPDLAAIHHVDLLDSRRQVLATVAPVRRGAADLEIEAPAAAIERAWFLCAYATDGTLIESRCTELGEAMKRMQRGPQRRDE